MRSPSASWDRPAVRRARRIRAAISGRGAFRSCSVTTTADNVAKFYYVARYVSSDRYLRYPQSAGLLRSAVPRLTKLQDLLNALGWTQEQLADATGIRRTDINAICRGRIGVGHARLRLIADALNVSPSDLDADAPEPPRLLPLARLEALEAADATRKKDLEDLTRTVARLTLRVRRLEGGESQKRGQP